MRVVRPFVLLSCLAVGCSGNDEASPVDAVDVDAIDEADASVDAVPIDAMATGRVLVSWTFRREGVADPVVTCADLGAEVVEIGAPSHLNPSAFAVETDCDQGFALIEDVRPQTLAGVEVLMMRPAGTGRESRLALRTTAPVTVVADSITHVPLSFRLFDEPVPQLQQIFDGAAAFYAASPDPKVFPSGTPNTAPNLLSCLMAPEGICQPNASLWTAPPFSQLGFRVTTLSRFSYSFTSSGNGASATFTITATADYDSDAAQRQYTINGSVAANGTVVGRETISLVDQD